MSESEKHAEELLLRINPFHVPSLAAELAAAEERGRRRGVEEAEAIEAHAKALADEADRRGTSLVIHRCPRGEWIIGFGMDMQEVLAQEPDFGNALFAATILRALAPPDSAPADWRDDADKLIEKLKPRDSGKGFSNADEPFADLVAAKDRK